MKKIMFGIAGVMVVLASANAVDVSQIKVACQASDETLWVERNQVCIPRNPCKDSKYESYCNRKYANEQLMGTAGDWRMTASNDYKVLIEAYAIGHNLSCVPVDTVAKALGDDYVICMGTDVMVFQFDDISNATLSESKAKDRFDLLVCEAIGGAYSSDTRVCKGIGKNECDLLERLEDKYENGGGAYVVTTWKDDECHIN